MPTDRLLISVWDWIAADKVCQTNCHLADSCHKPDQPAEAGSPGVGGYSLHCHAHCRRQRAQVFSMISDNFLYQFVSLDKYLDVSVFMNIIMC